MTQELHPQTRVQRAKDPGIEPAEKRRRGYEHHDAPPGKVTAGVAAFMSLVFIGLVVSAGTIEALDARHGLYMHYPAAPLFVHASLPTVLADPVRHRQDVEREARSHLDPARIEAAMRQVEQQHRGRAQ